MLIPQPDPDDPRWGLDDPAAGKLYAKSCFYPLGRTTGGPLAVDGLAWLAAGYEYAANGQPPAPIPPVDPAVLAQRAIKELAIPSPNLHYGPFPTQVAVKVPLWLWVDNPGPLSITVTAGTVSVTATAAVTTTTWSMGDTGTNATPGATSGHAASNTFTCQGTGQAPTAASYQTTPQPPCGYTYIWQSTAARTGNACTWPVTTTANWTANWTSNTGAAGTLNMTSTTATTIRVGQWHSILISNPNAAIPPAAPDPNCLT